ncbi:YHYH protein [Stieleria varia]|uniref:Putative kinase inhibitor n=1 Tax=Stieleria varia TaxID=2528005 RepID=A0A5C6AET6_9BACT|nr:YHYH protein [Stieleria varia]TWT98484.1 putative kinase inhibitor [Stieleria varia]
MISDRPLSFTVVAWVLLAGIVTAHDDVHDGAHINNFAPDHAAGSHEFPESAFSSFQHLVRVRRDDQYLWIESNGLPRHGMMTGIRSWQQQVPLPQPYTGQNAWRIPLKPKLAERPISARTNLFRGAIAIAVNGVPIFNALNNRGEDAFLAGELDNWGGHCGRGDDYHYHIAPVHLEAVAGKGNPIAFALDGFPLYGYLDHESSDAGELDEFNGQFDEQGKYHYHATKTYPYINGGLRGVVNVRDGQIDPQPRDSPARPPGNPLRGAAITDFHRDGNQFRLTYELANQKGTIEYTTHDGGRVDFQFQPPGESLRSESYQRRGGIAFLQISAVASDEPERVQDDSTKPKASLIVSSPAFDNGGVLPPDFTCDGAGDSPPLSWTQGPPGTVCYAVSLWHIPGPGDIKSYWLIYDIPATVTELSRNAVDVGVMGLNDKGQAKYDPMCSRGPGEKTYNATVYALSEKPEWNTTQVTRAELLSRIAGITIAEGTLSFRYSRSSISDWRWLALGLATVVVVTWLGFRWHRRSRITTGS